MRCVVASLIAVSALQPVQDRSTIAERVTRLTRVSPWTLVTSIPVSFRTFHPQGMVKIGDIFVVSSVEVIDPITRESGVGHLFKIDGTGNLIADLRIGEGSIQVGSTSTATTSGSRCRSIVRAAAQSSTASTPRR
jgi:Family of unknown function (DUF6454)